MEDPLEKGLVPIGDDGVILLGAPLGSAEFVGGEIEKKILLFRFAVFLKNRFVFHSNEHFLISKISFHQIRTSFQCTIDRVCFTITSHHLEWLQIWPQDGATCHLEGEVFANI